ncbi:PucR family transcriptional regulator [Nocardioides sp. NPDC087217]|uniref:PucR family transcriptional regulator n=1 Tax=Nocardioides sp. NPDC087217 TaxID=3364335 RepID=UPI00382A6EFB
MGRVNGTPADVRVRAEDRAAEVTRLIGAALPDVATALHAEIADAIPELRGDDVILELLRASVESNVETFFHVLQHRIAFEEILPPPAAIEYARRLAQRGISSNALLRAYRIGQSWLLDLAVAEVARQEPDREVALAAAQILQRGGFAYVDRVAEQVVAEYESERERWLANRNTVRAATLTALLAGGDLELGAAENALGYRLRQHHLGLVVWDADGDGAPTGLRRLEALVAAVGERFAAAGQPLFMPQDSSHAWAWIPLGRKPPEATDIRSIIDLVTETAADRARVALGRPHPAVAGFRASHREAVRAHLVATTANDRGSAVTTYEDPGVQIASILAHDLDEARQLVTGSLGALAVDDEPHQRLRETLLAFLGAKSSYLAAAEVLHLHKNTVKYRVDKAAEVRGRAIDEDRLNLELALTACRWLGASVLTRADSHDARP